MEVRTFSNGPWSPDLLREIHQFCLSKTFWFCRSIGEILFCKIVPFETNVFISIMFEHGFTKITISHETIVNSCELPLDASLFQIMGKMIFFLFWNFPISVAMKSFLLNYVLWIWRKVQYIFKWHLDWPQFLSRDARMCNGRCLHSGVIGILCTAS